MAEPLPNEDQDPATGFQSDATGEEVMASLAKADTAVQPAAIATLLPLAAAAYGAR